MGAIQLPKRKMINLAHEGKSCRNTSLDPVLYCTTLLCANEKLTGEGKGEITGSLGCFLTLWLRRAKGNQGFDLDRKGVTGNEQAHKHNNPLKGKPPGIFHREVLARAYI